MLYCFGGRGSGEFCCLVQYKTALPAYRLSPGVFDGVNPLIKSNSWKTIDFDM